ncbi:hypothetical protein A6A27_37125 [Micromonospora sp. CB01531]|nr:hypothetical protein A6A27_37125 [Micromonospora sp. CB01531]
MEAIPAALRDPHQAQIDQIVELLLSDRHGDPAEHRRQGSAVIRPGHQRRAAKQLPRRIRQLLK